MQLNLIILKDKYAIYRFETDSDIPNWIRNSDFYSITKTKDELSIISKQLDLTTEVPETNKDWRILKIQGPLDFSLIGIIAEISRILKEIKISIFTISTYDTDYIFLKNQDLNKAIDSLKANGHKITYEN
jgi:hypothetical protein